MPSAPKIQKDETATCKEDFDAVVVLHGIGRTRTNMYMVERRLEAAGYTPYNFSYPSVTQDISALSAWLARELAEQEVWQKHGRVHFVTHSMGGLVAGQYLGSAGHGVDADEMADKMGRVVMLGVPHGGSEVSDFLHKNWLYKRAYGPAGQQLTTEYRRAQPLAPWYDLGVIAGTSNWNYPIGNMVIEGEHDGQVSVESTKIPAMTDHIALPVQHWSMVWQPSVLDQIEFFLAQGKFNAPTKEANTSIQGSKNNDFRI